jgi:FkbM family methyltransferase
MRFVSRAWRYRLLNDPEEIRYLLAHVKRGDIVVDIGAHKGAYAYWMRRCVDKGGCVYAFEPQPELASHLKTMFSYYQRGAKVVVENLALSCRPGRFELFVPGEGVSPSATFHPKEGDSCHAYPVAVDTLDHYFLQCRRGVRLNFIKCDVEGHELEVFRGGEELLRSQTPTLMFECEQRHRGKGSIEEVFDYLQCLGYEGFYIDNNRLESIRGFKPLIHQRCGITPYINNFIFCSRSGNHKNVEL